MHNVWPNEFQQQNRLDHFTLLRLVFSKFIYEEDSLIFIQKSLCVWTCTCIHVHRDTFPCLFSSRIPPTLPWMVCHSSCWVENAWSISLLLQFSCSKPAKPPAEKTRCHVFVRESAWFSNDGEMYRIIIKSPLLCIHSVRGGGAKSITGMNVTCAWE